MITEITRGHIRLKVQSKSLTVQGEMLFPDAGSNDPSYVIYADSIQRWDRPFDREFIDDQTKGQIMRLLTEEMAKRGSRIVIE